MVKARKMKLGENATLGMTMQIWGLAMGWNLKGELTQGGSVTKGDPSSSFFLIVEVIYASHSAYQLR